MQIIARIEGLDQIGPDDYRVRATTKIFEETDTLKEVHAWANTHGSYPFSHIELTQPQG